MKKNYNQSRRQFLAAGSLASLGLLFAKPAVFGFASAKPDSKFGGVQIGCITYSFRSMPGSIDDIINYLTKCGISATELMGDAVEEYAGKPVNPVQIRWVPGQPRPTFTDEQRAAMKKYQEDVKTWRESVSMDKFKEVRTKLDQAGISVYAYKPNAFSPNNSDGEVEYALKTAKILGAKSVTVELPTDPKQTQRLGDLGQKHGIYFGYHTHTQVKDTVYDEALAQSPYNSINLDAGHYIAVGAPHTAATLLAFIEAKKDRITSMHIKDRTSKENGAKNLVWGTGETPLKELLTAMKKNKYKFPATIELEYDIPTGSDAVAEVKKCVEYAKAILI
jgi:sugar phosphate isomerase/epimerase